MLAPLVLTMPLPRFSLSRQVLDRHTDRVTDLAWSPDGGLLLSSSQDGSACLWRAEGGDLERSFRNMSGPLGCCCFHPANPNLLLLGTAAGELLALNASTGKWRGMRTVWMASGNL